jgi:hypothetical protein
MNEDGDPIERKKLFGLGPGHPGAQSCRGKNRKDLHTGWSIQRMALPAEHSLER